MKSSFEIITPREGPDRGRRRGGTGAGHPQWMRRGTGIALLVALVVLASGVGYSAWANRAAVAYNAHNLIRLHVVANSDSPSDQALKLEVRDAILEASGQLFSVEAPSDAEAQVRANLPLFKQVAENVLNAAGYDYPVEVEYGVFAFPERAYGALVLPAGDYEALRIVLGTGGGANWWCILFPPLCYLDVVGGTQESSWSVAADGRLVGASGAGAAGGGRAIDLSTLTAEQLEDLGRILGTAIEEAEAPELETAGEPGVGLLVTEVPGSEENLVVLVADTGDDQVEVRFYLVDRFKEFLGSLAQMWPGLFGAGGPTADLPGAGPER